MKKSIEVRNKIVDYFDKKGKEERQINSLIKRYDSMCSDYLGLHMFNNNDQILIAEEKEAIQKFLKETGIGNLFLEYKERQLEEIIDEFQFDKLFKKKKNGENYQNIKVALNKEYIKSCDYIKIENINNKLYLIFGYKNSPIISEDDKLYFDSTCDSEILHSFVSLFGNMDFCEERVNRTRENALKTNLEAFKELKKEIEAE